MEKAKTAAVKLGYPVQLADRLLAEIIIRRPSMGDLLDYPVGPETGLPEELALMAHLCGLHADDLRALDAEDYGRLQEQLLRFRGLSDEK